MLLAKSKSVEGCLLMRRGGCEEKVCLVGCSFYIRATSSIPATGKKREDNVESRRLPKEPEQTREPFPAGCG